MYVLCRKNLYARFIYILSFSFVSCVGRFYMMYLYKNLSMNVHRGRKLRLYWEQIDIDFLSRKGIATQRNAGYIFSLGILSNNRATLGEAVVKTVSFSFFIKWISETTVVISARDRRIRLLRFMGNRDFTQVHVLYIQCDTFSFSFLFAE